MLRHLGLAIGVASVLAASEGSATAQYYYYPPPAYAYPAYPPPVVVVRPLPQPFTGPPPAQVWYHCDDPQGYYPYVRSCTHAWQPVPASTPSAATGKPTTITPTPSPRP